MEEKPQRYYLIVDTETGGTRPNLSACLQVASMLYDRQEDVVMSYFEEYIYPPKHLLIERQAIEATGFDLAKSLAADPEIIVAGRFKTWTESCRESVDQDLMVAAYNAVFDVGMIAAMQKRTGMRFCYRQGDDIDGTTVKPWFCVLQYARKYLKEVLPNCQLKTVAAHAGYGMFRAHDAGADVRATRFVWRYLDSL